MLNAKFIHKLYDYSNLPENTFGQRLKKLRLSKGLSQHELGSKVCMKHSMIGSYEREEFYPILDSINKLGVILDVNILCSEGYSKFLLESYKFKDKLVIWRSENNLTKRAASKLLSISEKGYSLWEDGGIMSSTTYYKIETKLLKNKLIAN
ncbi:helix-turn-helix transcriptional regulator [Romboutsia sedimentorum]|uniref:helix-turn-helix domain-containing protein n=1 Tax=Romboutsia sedimentorum TaxID=1368474 RepID=UPI0024DE2820|nr:helix-turn-helix transcriptional regulator [Romboutsia sedimentorum]MDK2585018.1 helix-turn-helix transcriptional regulator [Romboutsia sedimentorum]